MGQQVIGEFTASEKLRARQKCICAIRSGRLVRGSCENCGALKTEAHHDDYSKPLDVRWLCKPCHGAAHRGRTGRSYRRNTHCARGHELAGNNLMFHQRGDGLGPKRKCRLCHNDADRRSKQRRENKGATR